MGLRTHQPCRRAGSERSPHSPFRLQPQGLLKHQPPGLTAPETGAAQEGLGRDRAAACGPGRRCGTALGLAAVLHWGSLRCCIGAG